VAQEKIIYFGVGAQTLFELANLAFLRVGCSFKLESTIRHAAECAR